jgi:hypothetical protein
MKSIKKFSADIDISIQYSFQLMVKNYFLPLSHIYPDLLDTSSVSMMYENTCKILEDQGG